MAGEGVAVIDPHGDLAEAIIDAIPPERTHQVCYLNVADTQFPVGFNPLARVPADRRALAASGIVSAFKHLWRESWGPRLEHFLFQGVAALLESPRPTLLDLSRLYTDRGFRERLVSRITDPTVARFWRQEFPSYDQRFQAEAVAPILNKVGQITASPILRNILGQHSPKFDLAHAMDNGGILVANLADPPIEAGGILIANLAKGKVGEQASNLLGSLLLSHLQLVAMARSDLAEENRRPFFVHIDEFQSFSTEAFASLLSEARKFATHFCLANQYTEQLSDGIRAAVLGNAGTLMVFRVSAADAELLAPEFHPLPAHELADQSPYGPGYAVATAATAPCSSRHACMAPKGDGTLSFGRAGEILGGLKRRLNRAAAIGQFGVTLANDEVVQSLQAAIAAQLASPTAAHAKAT
jgi:hypothetical protein